jgi:hypothetical protein
MYNLSELVKVSGFNCYLVVDIFKFHVLSVQVSYQTAVSTVYSMLFIFALVI